MKSVQRKNVLCEEFGGMYSQKSYLNEKNKIKSHYTFNEFIY